MPRTRDPTPPGIRLAPEEAESLGFAGCAVFRDPPTPTAIDRAISHYWWATDDYHTLVFTGATAAHADAIDTWKYERITFSGGETGLLFVSAAPHYLTRMLFAKMLHWMSMNDRCPPSAWSKKPAVLKAANGARLQADLMLRPKQPRPSDEDFPTLVFMMGQAEDYPALCKQKDLWFESSPPDGPQGDVKVVILITTHWQSRHTVLEQWHRGQETASQRVVVKPNPEAIDVIEVSRKTELEFEDIRPLWIIEGAPLEIKFEDMYLRPKERKQRDFSLTEEWIVYSLIKSHLSSSGGYR